MTSTFGCVNCTAEDDFDDFSHSKFTISTVRTRSTQGSEDSDILNVSYRHATPVFRSIEKENWEGLLLFLTTGKWKNSILAPSTEHLKSPAASLQVKTWVTSYDAQGQPEWSQLPLHAAISYNAPYPVIKKLVDMYPKSIQCTDNEGMLPIHLAFGFGASEPVLALLLKDFPSSVNEKGLGGRFPYECCELGPNKTRGEIYQIVMDQVSNRIRNEIDQDWRNFVKAGEKTFGLSKHIAVEEKTLTEVLLELLKTRKQLEDMVASSSKSALTTQSTASRSKRQSPRASSSSSPKTKSSSSTSNRPVAEPRGYESTRETQSLSSKKSWGNRSVGRSVARRFRKMHG